MTVAAPRLRPNPRRGLAWPVALVGALAALALWPTPAQAWCRTTTSAQQPDPLECPASGTPVAWPEGCAALHLDPRVPAGALPLEAVRRAASSSLALWAQARCDAAGRTHPGFRLTLLGDLEFPLGYAESGPNANTVRVAATWPVDPFHHPDAAALTVVTFRGALGTIVDTDIEINARSPSNPRGLPFAIGADAGAGLDLDLAVAHEIGHAHGLAHSSVRDAVMWAVVQPGTTRRALDPDDEQGICAVYPPRDVSACDTALLGASLHGEGAGCAAGPAGAARPRAAGALLALACAARVGRRGGRRRRHAVAVASTRVSTGSGRRTRRRSRST